jgi:hypothetical protein
MWLSVSVTSTATIFSDLIGRMNNSLSITTPPQVDRLPYCGALVSDNSSSASAAAPLPRIVEAQKSVVLVAWLGGPSIDSLLRQPPAVYDEDARSSLEMKSS